MIKTRTHRPARIVRAGALALLTALLATPALAAEPTAQEIVDKMLDNNNTLGVESGHAQLRLVIEDRAGTKRQRDLDVRSKKVGGNANTIVKLTAPAAVKGQAFLFKENKKAEDDVWMFLPAFKVTRRIEGSQKKGAFLGSHFSFSDLESRDIKDASLKRLPDEKIGKDAVYVIESTPKKPADSEYGKVISYIRKSDHITLKARFYAKDAKTVKKTLFVEKIAYTSKKKPYAKQMTLRPKNGGFTTIAVTAINEGAQLPDSIFSRGAFGK